MKPILLTINGETRSITGWAKHAHRPLATILLRLKRGWTPEDAVFGEAFAVLEIGDRAMTVHAWSKEPDAAPYGTIYALESLEVVLIAATLDQDVSLVFIDDGVYQLVKGQQTKDIGIKNFSPSYRALEGYDVEKLYVDQDSLAKRGLSKADLLVPVEVLDSAQMAELMAQQDVLLSF